MKNLLTILLLCPLFALAQGSGISSRVQTVSGEITIPALQSIRIEVLNNSGISLEKPEDLVSPKVIADFCRVTVTSNVPWIVDVSLNSPYLTGLQGTDRNQKLPGSILEMKGNTGGFIPLSNSPIPLLRSENEKLQNSYLVSLKINPNGILTSGKYNTNIIFTITPE
ncbi:MAG TPA: hypothetical protein VHM26_09560 [Chitinophagaceae bacterium]|jgi:hypothetical protein|nr:hypothetical protein [Chitinophagaceae bacterium]